MLDPSKGGIVTPAQQIDQTFGTADNSVRYMDDKGDGGQQTWDAVVEQYGDESIIMVGVSQGYSMGTDVSAMVRNIKLNDTTYAFDMAPADDQAGAAGQSGPEPAPRA